MICIDEARDIASRTGWLSQTSAPFCRAVVDRTRLQEADANETIYNVGDPAGGMYCLIEGALRVSIAPGGSGPYFAHLFAPGTWTGEGTVITGGTRIIGLSAARKSLLLYLPLHSIQEILQKDPTAWRFLAALNLAHTQTALQIVEDLMIRDHVKRLIAIVLRLGNCNGSAIQDGKPIDVDVNHEDLATMANLARTTVGATLRQLEADGYVDLSYRHIVLLKPDKLRAMLNK